MKRENDEITDLFRSRLSNTEMTVRDGFWEELENAVPVACQHRRRLMFFRVAAAASVLLVLAASSATFWYLSPKEDMEEAFTKIAMSTNVGSLNGDGVQVNPLPIPIQPVLQKPTPKAFALFSQNGSDAEEDSITFSFSMTFSFTETTSTDYGIEHRNPNNGVWQAGVGTETNISPENEQNVKKATLAKSGEARTWAVKPQVSMALPADNGLQKMPISVGVTVEKKLNKYLGIETGLLYSNLRSKGQKLHYLGIPVKLNLTFAETKKVDLYATVGGIADKCIAGAPDNDFKHEPVQLALTAGVGINYKINDRIALFAEPGISHHFKNDSKLATVRTERPTNFNLICGVRMTY